MNAEEVVSDPRYHHQYLPDVVEYEKGALTDEEITRLLAMGHRLEQGERRWGNMQVVIWDFASGKVTAASDPRGEGEGLVY
jgi:gamma-glutamyltranspeptidase/glutathione hydrolase